MGVAYGVGGHSRKVGTYFVRIKCRLVIGMISITWFMEQVGKTGGDGLASGTAQEPATVLMHIW